MISSEVQRTLVKSPPELWTELSDPASLGRHLGEFGEIRITRVEPEKTVEWEAENTSGSVLIKPSGWGTRVILKATREPTEPELTEPEPELTEPEPPAASEPPATDAEELEPLAEIDEDWTAEPVLEQASEIHPEPLTDEPAGWEEPQWQYEAEAEAEAEEEPETEPRRGFLARLFGWRRRQRAADLTQDAREGELPLEWRAATDAAFEPAPEWPQEPEPSMSDAPQDDSLPPQPSAPEPLESLQPEPAALDATATAPDPAPAAAEEVAAEDVEADEVAAAEVTAVLTSMLDRLGTAHHRPFSRA